MIRSNLNNNNGSSGDDDDNAGSYDVGDDHLLLRDNDDDHSGRNYHDGSEEEVGVTSAGSDSSDSGIPLSISIVDNNHDPAATATADEASTQQPESPLQDLIDKGIVTTRTAAPAPVPATTTTTTITTATNSREKEEEILKKFAAAASPALPAAASAAASPRNRYREGRYTEKEGATYLEAPGLRRSIADSLAVVQPGALAVAGINYSRREQQQQQQQQQNEEEGGGGGADDYYDNDDEEQQQLQQQQHQHAVEEPPPSSDTIDDQEENNSDDRMGTFNHNNSTITTDNTSFNRNMVRARPINENDDDIINVHTLPQAYPSSRSSSSGRNVRRPRTQEEAHQAKSTCYTLVITALMSVGLIIGLCIVFAVRDTNTTNGNMSNDSVDGDDDLSSSTTALLTQAQEQATEWNFPSYTVDAIGNSSTPQAMAYEWLVNDPYFYYHYYEYDNYNGQYNNIHQNMSQESLTRLQQRYALATFYHSTGGPDWDINEFWLDYGIDECFWFARYHDQVPNATIQPRPMMISPVQQQQQQQQQQEEVQVDGGENETALSSTTSSPSSLQQNSSFACNENGEYITLAVQRLRLVGTIPKEVVMLPKLQQMRLFFQEKLYGTVPTELGLLTHLEKFVSGVNYHSGTIPTEFGLCTAMNEFRLDFAPLSGGIPSEFGNMELLGTLGVQCTTMTGPLPTELFRLENMKQFSVQNNHFMDSNNTLERIHHMSSLEYFVGTDVSFKGTLPTEIGLLSNSLTRLELDNVQLSGPIPSELGLLNKLERLHLNNNYMTGPFFLPEYELGRLSNMVELRIGANAFSGTLPSDIWINMPNLTIVKLNDNLFTGTIPTELGNLIGSDEFRLDDADDDDEGMEVWLHNNEGISGTIPTEFGLMTDLKQLFLHETNLQGSIPTEFANLTKSLKFLTVPTSGLSGTIPSELCGVIVDVYAWACDDLLGVFDEICLLPQTTNLTCHESSMLCGCECDECPADESSNATTNGINFTFFDMPSSFGNENLTSDIVSNTANSTL